MTDPEPKKYRIVEYESKRQKFEPQRYNDSLDKFGLGAEDAMWQPFLKGNRPIRFSTLERAQEFIKSQNVKAIHDIA